MDNCCAVALRSRCSTPFGDEAIGTTSGSWAEREESPVLNAFRRRGDRDLAIIGTVESHVECAQRLSATRRSGRTAKIRQSVAGMCSTPFGDEAIGTMVWPSSAQSALLCSTPFGDEAIGTSGFHLSGVIRLLCSTPFGDEAIGTRRAWRLLGQVAKCSTPFGDEAIGTICPMRSCVVFARCSTPFGDEAIGTGQVWIHGHHRDVLNAFRRRGDRDLDEV